MEHSAVSRKGQGITRDFLQTRFPNEARRPRHSPGNPPCPVFIVENFFNKNIVNCCGLYVTVKPLLSTFRDLTTVKRLFPSGVFSKYYAEERKMAFCTVFQAPTGFSEMI